MYKCEKCSATSEAAAECCGENMKEVKEAAPEA